MHCVGLAQPSNCRRRVTYTTCDTCKRVLFVRHVSVAMVSQTAAMTPNKPVSLVRLSNTRLPPTWAKLHADTLSNNRHNSFHSTRSPILQTSPAHLRPMDTEASRSSGFPDGCPGVGLGPLAPSSAAPSPNGRTLRRFTPLAPSGLRGDAKRPDSREKSPEFSHCQRFDWTIY